MHENVSSSPERICEKLTLRSGKISKFTNKHSENITNIMQVKLALDMRTCLFIRKVRVLWGIGLIS